MKLKQLRDVVNNALLTCDPNSKVRFSKQNGKDYDEIEMKTQILDELEIYEIHSPTIKTIPNSM